MSLTPEQIAQVRSSAGLSPSPASSTMSSLAQRTGYESAPTSTQGTGTPPGVQMLKDTAKAYADTPGKIGNDISEGARDYQEGTTKGGVSGEIQATKGIIKAGARTAGDVAGAVYAPIGAAIDLAGMGSLTKAVQDTVSKESGTGSLIDKITNIPAVQEFAMKHPNAGEDLSRLLNIIFTGGEEGKIDPKTAIDRTKTQINEGIDSTKQQIQQVKTDLTTKPSETTDNKTYQNHLEELQQIIYPKLTPTERAKIPLKESGSGLMKSSVPDFSGDKRIQGVLESVANLPDDIKLQKGESIAQSEAKLNQGIARLHQGTEASLSDPLVKASTSFNEARFNKYMTEKVLDPVKSEFGMESEEYKAAQRAINSARSGIESKDAHGVYVGRQKFSAKWSGENPRTFSKAKGSFGGQLDAKTSATVEAGRDVYGALNDFTEELLPENHPLRSRMHEESNLINAKEQMRTRSADQVGKSGIERTISRFKKENPVTTSVATGGIKAAGLGAGLHLMP